MARPNSKAWSTCTLKRVRVKVAVYIFIIASSSVLAENVVNMKCFIDEVKDIIMISKATVDLQIFSGILKVDQIVMNF